jgi:alpha-L-rhamnosidase
MHGEIESHWRRDGERLTWTFRVPPNTTARIYIPTGEDDTEIDTDGLRLISSEPGFAVCEAPAGRYAVKSLLATAHTEELKYRSSESVPLRG